MIKLDVIRLGLAAMLTVPFVAAAHSQPSSFGIDRDTGSIICTDDGDAIAVSDDPSYRAAALWDQMVLGEQANLCATDLTPIDNGTWGETRAFSGVDASGKRADFRMYVLHDRYSWSLGSSRQIEDDGRFVRFSEVLETPQFFERFCSAKAAMAFGATSYEGSTASNHALARARADTLGDALGSARGSCAEGQIPIIFSVNLGEHLEEAACTEGDVCPTATADQRRVIIVAAEQFDFGVNLTDALRTALTQQSILTSFDVRRYDLFDVAQN